MNARLVLIDGHAILHRAYHALPQTFSNKAGQSTNAIYGFMAMLLRVLSDLKPDYLAVAFDLPVPTFRQQQYTQYQARRPEMESNLKDQVTLVHELLDTLKIPYFEVAGFEADDIIGSLASQASEVGSQKSDIRYPKSDIRNLETVIVTGDRDMLQLVNSHVKLYVPVKGLSETKAYDLKAVKDEFGVEPSQWADVKALKGDPSDNYPGVSGIGPKTAQELIAKYGTLENLYKSLGKLDKKVATKLAEGAESAGMGKKLATIVTDVPIHFEPKSAEVGSFDWTAGVKYMREKLGFRTISERVEKIFLRNVRPDSAKAPPGKQMKLI